MQSANTAVLVRVEDVVFAVRNHSALNNMLRKVPKTLVTYEWDLRFDHNGEAHVKHVKAWVIDTHPQAFRFLLEHMRYRKEEQGDAVLVLPCEPPCPPGVPLDTWRMELRGTLGFSWPAAAAEKRIPPPASIPEQHLALLHSLPEKL
jgi:hypothetical protein